MFVESPLVTELGSAGGRGIRAARVREFWLARECKSRSGLREQGFGNLGVRELGTATLAKHLGTAGCFPDLDSTSHVNEVDHLMVKSVMTGQG